MGSLPPDEVIAVGAEHTGLVGFFDLGGEAEGFGGPVDSLVGIAGFGVGGGDGRQEISMLAFGPPAEPVAFI
jgi:hypothetical protein